MQLLYALTEDLSFWLAIKSNSEDTLNMERLRSLYDCACQWRNWAVHWVSLHLPREKTCPKGLNYYKNKISPSWDSFQLLPCYREILLRLCFVKNVPQNCVNNPYPIVKKKKRLLSRNVNHRSLAWLPLWVSHEKVAKFHQMKYTCVFP